MFNKPRMVNLDGEIFFIFENETDALNGFGELKKYLPDNAYICCADGYQNAICIPYITEIPSPFPFNPSEE